MEITDKEIIQLIYFKMRYDLPYQYKGISENIKYGYLLFNETCIYPLKNYEYLFNYLYVEVCIDKTDICIKLTKRPINLIPNVTNKKLKLANHIYDVVSCHLSVKYGDLLSHIKYDDGYECYKLSTNICNITNIDEYIKNIADFIFKINEATDLYIKMINPLNWDNIGIKKGDKLYLYDVGRQVTDKNNRPIYGIYLGNNTIKSNGIIGKHEQVASMLINKYQHFIEKTEDLNGDWY